MAALIKAVIFDFGHVLSQGERPGRSAEMARICGLGVPAFKAVYAEHRPEYDRGRLSGAQYWQLVTERAGRKLGAQDTASLIELDTSNSTELNPLMLGWAGQLAREGLRTAILSNMTCDDMSRMEREGVLERLGSFQVKVFSCRVGLVKPEEAIYRHCLGELELEPVETLFIDDKEVNTEAARRLGMGAFRFRSAEEDRQVPRRSSAGDLQAICRRYDLPLPAELS
jgi:putative hydrolase of the HAD superfamily